MDAVGIGLIGSGRIAQAAHLPALSKADGARLAAVCDPSTQISTGVGARYGVPGYTEVDDLLADPAVEAVVVAVPDRLHLPLAARALQAGKHVLVEKPIAGTLAQATELAELGRRSGLLLQVGAMKRFDPGVQYAAAAVGSLGRILTVSGWYRVMSALRPPTEATLFPHIVVDQDVRAREATYKADRESYLLVTHGAHVFDGLRFLAGDVEAVSAQLAAVNGDLSWHALMNMSSGAIAHVEITANVHSEWSEGFDVHGEKGHVKLRSHFPFALRASDVEVFHESTLSVTRPVFGDTNPYERQIEAFAAAVRTGVGIRPDAADGVASVALIEAVAASVLAGGARVEL